MVFNKYSKLFSILFLGIVIGIALNSRSIKKLLSNRIYQKSLKTPIALFHIEGSINKASAYLPLINQCSNPYYKGVIIHIDSGGGTSGSGDLLFMELKKLNTLKPIVVIVENMCCSAAYEIACAADCIIAPPGADIGSIGTRLTLERGLENSNPAESSCVILHAGEYKVAGDPNVPFTDTHKKYFQNLVNKDYEQFCSYVAESRNLSLDTKNEWANGQIFKATEAQKLGLTDKIGCYSDAKDTIKELLQPENNNNPIELEVIDLK